MLTLTYYFIRATIQLLTRIEEVIIHDAGAGLIISPIHLPRPFPDDPKHFALYEVHRVPFSNNKRDT